MGASLVGGLNLDWLHIFRPGGRCHHLRLLVRYSQTKGFAYLNTRHHIFESLYQPPRGDTGIVGVHSHGVPRPGRLVTRSPSTLASISDTNSMSAMIPHVNHVCTILQSPLPLQDIRGYTARGELYYATKS